MMTKVEKWLIGLLMCGEPQVGAVTIRQIRAWLREKEIGLGQFWQALEKYGLAMGLTGAKIAALKQVKEKFGRGENLEEYLAGRKIRFMVAEEANFPPLLREIYDAPAGLFYQGEPVWLGRPALAVVGTREITSYGRRAVKELLQAPLQQAVIVSGLMTGVDEAAHRQALAIGAPTTAILGYGLEMTWPRYVSDLRSEILAKGGALVSEYAPWSGPQKFRFPLRNRLVAGMSQAVLIVEAASKSGSLITANLALEDGREVLVVPGSIFSPLSNGVLGLLKMGATPVTNTGEIMTALAASPLGETCFREQLRAWQQEKQGVVKNKRGKRTTSAMQFANEKQEKIYQCLAETEIGQTAEELANNLDLEITQVLTELSLLQVASKVRQNLAGLWEIS